MAEVLSQQEIDALLNNVQSGASEPSTEIEKDVIPFDFRLPNRISKNQLRTIRNIHETFSESFSSFLVSKLQNIVNINVASVDQIYYSEYVLSVSNPACLHTFEILDTDIKGILEFGSDFALTLVDLLLGGSGQDVQKNKVITPIEQKVLNVVIDKIMQDLTKAWQMVDNFVFKMERFESDIDFAQITSQSESVLLITFEISIGEKSYIMNLCFATFAFDAVLVKLTNQNLSKIRPGKYNGTTAHNIIKANLYKAMVPITVEFGRTTINFKELMNLEEGDIIKLKNKISDEYPIKIKNKVLFLGRIGSVNKHKAIKITRKALNQEQFEQ